MAKRGELNPLVSVIVPMYNVEKYIRNCIMSILGQSYINIEVILINDGTPDLSGKIADELSHLEERVKVFHTENRGVSAARNLGIAEAKGSYIVFVDGDDTISSDFIEYMLNIVDKTGADFVMSKNCFNYPFDNRQISNDIIENLSPSEASALLLYPGKVNIGCWNKMFNRDFLLDNKIFFSTKFFMGEGLNFIAKAAELSNTVGVGKRKVYKYRVDNPNSATTVLNVPKYFNALKALDNIEDKSNIRTKEFKKAFKYHKYLTVFSAMVAILRAREYKKYCREFHQCIFLVRNEFFSILRCDISLNYKIRILMYCINPFLAVRIFFVLGNFKRKFLN